MDLPTATHEYGGDPGLPLRGSPGERGFHRPSRTGRLVGSSDHPPRRRQRGPVLRLTAAPARRGGRFNGPGLRRGRLGAVPGARITRIAGRELPRGIHRRVPSDGGRAGPPGPRGPRALRHALRVRPLQRVGLARGKYAPPSGARCPTGRGEERRVAPSAGPSPRSCARRYRCRAGAAGRSSCPGPTAPGSGRATPRCAGSRRAR